MILTGLKSYRTRRNRGFLRWVAVVVVFVVVVVVGSGGGGSGGSSSGGGGCSTFTPSFYVCL